MPPSGSSSSSWSAAFSISRCGCAPGATQNLFSLQGGTASLIAGDGVWRMVAAHALRPGDLLVAAGERVAADGMIRSGRGQIDQSLITGETAPVTPRPARKSMPGH